MTTFISPRMRKPAVFSLAGALFAAAWLIRGGPLWWVSIMTVIVTAVRVTAFYRMAGQDTDEGALAGSRADERQKQLSLRSRALACNAATVATFIGFAVAIATKSAAWWPFLLTLGALMLGYLFGLSNYGGDDEEPAGDAETTASAATTAR
jgi:hypothetical protein